MILFDFDGVFVDTFEMLRQLAWEIDGVVLSPEEYRELFDGHIFETNRRQELKSFDSPELRKKFLEAYRSALPNHLLCPGIDVVVAQIATQYPVHMVTSGDELSINAYLKQANLHHHFQSVLGWQTHESKVEKFKMLGLGSSAKQPALFVTDTLGDIAQASALNIPTVAVTWGFHGEDRLKRGNPHAIVKTPAELSEFVTRWSTLNL